METMFFRFNQRIDSQLLSSFVTFLEKASLHQKSDFDKYIIILFDTKGGELDIAIQIKELIQKSGLKFCAVAYKKVHSAAIPIFLSIPIRFGYEQASALLHRAEKTSSSVSTQNLKKSEKQIFKLIANALDVSLREVYKMADENTVITMSHPLSKKFFLNI